MDELTVRFPGRMGAEAEATALRAIAERVAKGNVTGKFGEVSWSFGAELGVTYRGDIPHSITAKDAEAEATRVRNAYRASGVFVLITEGSNPRLGHAGSVGFEDAQEVRQVLQTYLEQSAIGRGTS